MDPLDPTTLTYGLLATLVLFAVIAFLTRATWQRIVGVLISSVPIIFLVMLYDKIAGQLGWWHYPSLVSGSAPLAWYIAAALFYGAALGLIGWRVIRRWSWSGLVVFILLFAGSGVTRDYLYSTTTGLIRFGPGLIPLIADGFAYGSSALLVQALMVLIVGKPRTDRLARKPKTHENNP